MTTRRSTVSSAAQPAAAAEGLLSPELAFVVQFRTAAARVPPRFAGRIEHMASGQTVRFASAAELVAWLEAALTRRGSTPNTGGER
jgi:hypothetical protein